MKELFLYRDEDEDKLFPGNTRSPQNGDVCMYCGLDEIGIAYEWSVLRKNSNGAWSVQFNFDTELPLEIKVGSLPDQKFHHLLAGYTLRHIDFKQETVH